MPKFKVQFTCAFEVEVECEREDLAVTHGFFKVGGESEWAEEEFTLANKIRNAVLEIERKTQHHRASSL